jgi:hypothetical protein
MKPGVPASSPFWIAALCSLGALACGHHFPRPFPADEMVHIGTGAALADYLTQQNANAEVCDRQSRGPHMGVLRRDDLADLTDGLVDGSILPDVWQACASALLKPPPSEESATFFDTMGKGYEALVRRSDLETQPAVQSRLEALHQVFLMRPVGLEPHAPVMAELLARLQTAMAKGRLGPFATKHGEDLLATVELGHDRWKGAPVTTGVLDGLQAAGDEALLRRFALRLADKTLQVEARRRVIRLHIAASKWPEVTGHAADVEAAVLAAGRYAVDLAAHPPLTGSMDIAVLSMRGVLLRQNVEQQVVSLLADQGPRDRASAGTLLPELPLRGAVQVALRGISSPVTLCAPPEELDVTPCVLPHDVHVKTPFVDVDDGGRLHFIEHAHAADIFAEVRDRPKVSWPLEVGGRRIFNLDWPATFEKPADVVMAGAAGGLGPNMRVAAEERAERFFFKVDIGKGPLLVAIERPDTASFSIVTRGAAGRPGTPGAPGTNGAAGSAGSPGSCPGSPGGAGGNGSPGGPGGAGGPGGPGANGGDVLIEVSCAQAECQRLGKILERVVRSEGGAGGPGGPGGRGGQGGAGGSGGSGASCTDSQGHYMSVGGGPSGSSGANGASGPKGPDGPPGLPGKVVLAIVK